jgi:hypothetical protein
VPLSIRQGYEEAYKIKELSPNAATTLARRTLQGMIRHRWNLSGKRKLSQEINRISY